MNHLWQQPYVNTSMYADTQCRELCLVLDRAMRTSKIKFALDANFCKKTFWRTDAFKHITCYIKLKLWILKFTQLNDILRWTNNLDSSPCVHPYVHFGLCLMTDVLNERRKVNQIGCTWSADFPVWERIRNWRAAHPSFYLCLIGMS